MTSWLMSQLQQPLEKELLTFSGSKLKQLEHGFIRYDTLFTSTVRRCTCTHLVLGLVDSLLALPMQNQFDASIFFLKKHTTNSKKNTQERTEHVDGGRRVVRSEGLISRSAS